MSLLWAVLLFIPDVFDAVKFWVESVKAMGGVIGWIATMIDSPWFTLALIVVGLAWLRFADEPRYVVQHPSLPYVGWALVGIVFLAFWSVLVAGYTTSRIAQPTQQLQQKVTALEQRLLPRVLTDIQKKRLTDVLAVVPPGTRYRLTIFVIAGCAECSGYGDDLARTWMKVQGWEVTAIISHALSSRLAGVVVAVDIEGCPPEALRLITTALDASGIPYTRGSAKRIPDVDACGVFIGNKPEK